MDPASIASLPRLLSPARLGPYLVSVGSDPALAIRLYAWNMEAAGAFWGELNALEVALRNAEHTALAASFRRDDWWHHPNVRLHPWMHDAVTAGGAKAKKTANQQGRSTVADDVVAQLSFGFWTSLLGPGGQLQFETRFWQAGLRRAFPNYTNPSPRTLHAALERLRLFRNRIAHHEPIHSRDLRVDHTYVLTVAGYLHPELRLWIEDHSRVSTVLGRRADCVAGRAPTTF